MSLAVMTAAAAAAMGATGMTTVVVVVMIALHVGIVSNVTCQQCFHRIVRLTANTAKQTDTRLCQCHLCTATDAAANQNIHAIGCQKACQRTVTAAVGINDLLLHHLIVLDRVELKLGSVSKMLEDISIFISSTR